MDENIKIYAKLNNTVEENIRGIRIVKSYVTEEKEINNVKVINADAMKTDLARLIGNEFYPKNYSIFYPSVSDFVTVRIIQQEKVNIKSEIKNDNAHIDIKVPIFKEVRNT